MIKPLSHISIYFYCKAKVRAVFYLFKFTKIVGTVAVTLGALPSAFLMSYTNTSTLFVGFSA